MKNAWNKFTDKFGTTIIHPQFIVFSFTAKTINEIAKRSKNKSLIDIGSGRMPYRNRIEPLTKKYIAVDHPKISNLYNTNLKPDILADITKKIPVKSSQFDIAIMLEVLEYLENPEKTFSEIGRILKRNGVLILTSPFLYPIHDEPYDRNRFTKTQIETFLKKKNFKIKQIKDNGNFLSFYFLSINVFLTKRIFDILKRKIDVISFFYLFAMLAITPPIVIFTNILFLLTNDIKTKYPNYFPLDYLVIAIKQ